MCLAIPMELKEVRDETGVVEVGGVRREIQLTLMEDPKVGDYLIVHAGFAIQKLDKDQALKDLELFAEIERRAGQP
ncbi:MAG: HypC/HybG/HupF family hydrogenase formation chaperone [Elusimicrobiota bacterium]